MRFVLIVPLLFACLAIACRDWKGSSGRDHGGKAAAQGVWDRQSIPIRQDLFGVSFIDSQHGWAVGDIRQMEGQILRTSNGGANWTAIASCNELLSEVQFVDQHLGWVVGYAGRIQRTLDGGLTWQVLRSEHAEETLNSVWFVSPQVGWVVGAAGQILHTRDGGSTWETQPSGTSDDLWRVRMINAERGWIAGEAGTILFSDDGGRAWVRQTTEAREAFLGLSVVDEKTALACGAKGTIAKYDGHRGDSGAEVRSPDWRWVMIPSGTTESLNAIKFVAANVGWAVGSRGTILFTSDAAVTWTSEQSGITEDLIALAAVDIEHVWAVGRSGVILRRVVR